MPKPFPGIKPLLLQKRRYFLLFTVRECMSEELSERRDRNHQNGDRAFDEVPVYTPDDVKHARAGRALGVVAGDADQGDDHDEDAKAEGEAEDKLAAEGHLNDVEETNWNGNNFSKRYE